MDFSEPNYDILTVTPQMAREFLDNHKNYRSLTMKRVQMYSEAMQEGRWSIAQPLIFSDEGTLIDGQNRLEAVIRCGIPQRFTVLTGIPQSSTSAIDGGQPRTGNQVLKHERPDASSVAQVIRAVKELPSTEGRACLNSEIPILWDKYLPYIKIGCDMTQSKHKGICKAPFRASIVRALMCNPQHEDKIQTLVVETTSGIVKNSKNAGLLMKLLLAPYQSGSVMRVQLYLKCARILHAEIKNTQLSKIPPATTDFFPLPEQFQ